MNKLFTVATAIFFAITAFSSCVKTDTNSSVTTDPNNNNNQGGTFHVASYDDVNHLYAAIKPAAQSFTVTAGNMQTITTAKGSRINFYPNSFKNASGVILTSGTVNLSITEASKIADMISTRAFPVTTSGALLTSGGEINITATIGGQTVYANKYGVQFRQPHSTTQPMNLFLGTTGGNSVTTWTPAAATTGTTSTGAMPVVVDSTAIIDSASGTYTYSYVYSHDSYNTFDSCNNFNWINCDYFWGAGVTTTGISIALADTSFNAGNTAVYITFPSINSVMNTYCYSFNNFTTSGLPIGSTVGIVVMSYKGGNYYYSYEDGVTVTPSMTRTVTMTAHTFAELTTMLSTL